MTRTPLLSGAGFLLVVALAALAARSLALAVYATAFWHYYLYWLAYRHGAVPLATFKRDAVAAKTIALFGIGYAYLSAVPDGISLAVVACGFALNALGARALGSDRTYYGAEVAGLPPLRISAFPYSWIPHPMLFGNIAAFGGMLLDAEFRASWWPLALAHIALNAGLLWMEMRVKPLRGRAHPHVGTLAISVAMGIGVVSLRTWNLESLALALVAAGFAMHALVLHHAYTVPRTAPVAEEVS